ncbi:MAG: SDR family oxidoreductase [Actinobacteria bacterium]|nr:SDR family oxidoreductase [Actinomycetota bacterium]
MSTGPLPLAGRNALITGVSRRNGIGFAVAQRLAGLGARLFLHHYRPHDREQEWGADPGGVAAVVAGVGPDAVAGEMELDLTADEAPERLVRAACDALGHLDVLICNQATSGHDGPLGTLTAAGLDHNWAVNTRASILLAQAFAAQHDGRPGGRVIFMTSGQDLGPMRPQVGYAASKGALASITRTLADELADQAITLNTVNPGPVDTGYATGESWEEVRRRFPGGRWGSPEDPARLIGWLVTGDGGWITGQIINSEGGFRRGD